MATKKVAAKKAEWELGRWVSPVLFSLRRAYNNAVVSAGTPSYGETTVFSWGDLQTEAAEEANKPRGGMAPW